MCVRARARTLMNGYRLSFHCGVAAVWFESLFNKIGGVGAG